MAKSLNKAEERFIERMGQQAQADGISRIAGQIWAALILSDGPVSSSRLMEMLHISKGSVSTNTRMLELLNIIERRSKPRERQDYFAIRDNPYSALVEGQIKRFETAQAIVAEAKSSIGNRQAQEKIDDLARFYALYRDCSQALLDSLQAAPSSARKTGT